ncbi:DUF2799 domain-containing protein [Motilimonas pumila]|uniref:DUF2799 domain-containing protein n=1 Tax=Motilimonas pumila TaxID=2303987 RepID=A0A418YCV3_9GAMM|nr:DUF2799 domain-containing protein [Motilimonas pumila]RJG42311.1 DUF2799 domain-containing protein [Motilimonas pumila]
MKQTAVVICTFLLVQGCSSLPTNNNLAKAQQWSELGQRDGRLGKVQKTSEQLAELAAKQQVDAPDYSVYSEQYQQGVQSYCQQDAFQLGLEGKFYNDVCADLPNGGSFKLHWQRGWERFLSVELPDVR